MTFRSPGLGGRVRGRSRLLVPVIVVLVILVAVFLAFTAIWTDVLWYRSVGFSTVYTKQITTRVLLFFAVPFLAKALGYSDSTELDFRSLGFAALLCVVALPLATLLLVARVPRGASVQMPAPVQQRFGFREVVTAVRDNPPLLRLLAAFLPVNLLSGLAAGVTYLYMDTYLGLSQDYPAIMLLAMSASPAMPPSCTAARTFSRPSRKAARIRVSPSLRSSVLSPVSLANAVRARRRASASIRSATATNCGFSTPTSGPPG